MKKSFLHTIQTSPNKPEIREFGLTNGEYYKIDAKAHSYSCYYSNFDPESPYFFIPPFLAMVIPPLNSFFTLSLLVCIFCLCLAHLYRWINDKIIDSKITSIPKYKEYKKHQDKLSKYENELLIYKRYLNDKRKEEERKRAEKELEEKQKQHTYWRSIDPYEFERRITRLFEKQGYIAKTTKGSGDEGIDIHLKKNSKKGVVQCKRHNKKVGPAAIRDLYGTMVAGEYKFAYIVCPSGFSDKAYEFSKGKNIKLIGIKGIMEMVNS